MVPPSSSSSRSLGRHHAETRRLRALRRDRSLRDAQGVFVAEGIHLAQEALSGSAEIEYALISPRLETSVEGRRVLEELENFRIDVLRCSDSILDDLQEARSPQPILLLCRQRRNPLSSLLEAPGASALFVVLVGVQDPGNLGSILRTADAAGAEALIATGSGVDLYHPRTVRATMGSIFRLPAVPAETEVLLQALDEKHVKTVGAVAAGGQDYRGFDWSGTVALFLGGEGSGLPAAIAGRMRSTVSIPMRREVNSLSVGAAAAVLLFDARRAR